VAAVHKIRRDYRFAPETMQQISAGRAVFAGTLNETDFVERAIAHYAEFLNGDPVSQGQMTQEMERLHEQIRDLRHDQQSARKAAQLAAQKATVQAQEIEHLQAQVRDLERDLRTTQTTPLLTEETRARNRKTDPQAQTIRPQPTRHQEPQITLDDLQPDGTMRNYSLRWEQDGLLALASLESIDDHSSAYGYRLYCSCYSVARPGQPLTERQRSLGNGLIKLARTRLVEELLKAGWKPDDPTNPEASVTIWKYQGGNAKR
jgi:hypothetical protein